MVDVAAIARRLPDVELGIACAGTRLESRTFAVRGKAFLFLSATCVRLKLCASADDARHRNIEVGKNGWAKLAPDALPPTAVLARWIAESHALLAGASGGSGGRSGPARVPGRHRTRRPKP